MSERQVLNSVEDRNDWEALSDISNQVDEHAVRADFFVDVAPDAIFVPELDGVDK